MKTPLELLAPAGNTEIGKAAFDHGADAVYIGAPRFSARAQAGNSVKDIAGLVKYARLFNCRVYVALNTILTDSEIEQARNLIKSLYETGIDGLIIQDVGLLELDLPPVPLIASTQMHNNTVEKVKFLESAGFKRVILARELSLGEISAIRNETKVELEVFVHGSLCVSFSGRCYMSQRASGRSGNRGVCAQPCRHRYTLFDGAGKAVIEDKYLLSLKDMNRLEYIGGIAAAGVTSFKIEGRYKEIEYVKNITAAYRHALDNFIDLNSQYKHAGSGSCTFDFKPDPEKTFNRGFTRYFLNGGRNKIAAPDSPKSIGKFIGRVNRVSRDYFHIKGHDLVNGDGLCFFTKDNELRGCRVEKTEENMIYPSTMAGIAAGTAIYRNYDNEFSHILKRSNGSRKIAVEMDFFQAETGIRLKVKDEDGVTVELQHDLEFEPARNAMRARSNIEAQLLRTKDTPYIVTGIAVHSEEPGFLALRLINDLRRSALEKLTKARLNQFCSPIIKLTPNNIPYPENKIDYRANILNKKAMAFYERHGASVLETALESNENVSEPEGLERIVMTTKYCIRYELDACLKYTESKNRIRLTEPLRIRDRQHSYRLEFDCTACRMLIIEDSSCSG